MEMIVGISWAIVCIYLVWSQRVGRPVWDSIEGEQGEDLPLQVIIFRSAGSGKICKGERIFCSSTAARKKVESVEILELVTVAWFGMLNYVL